MTLSAPTKVCLAITARCNLNCKHCLAKSRDRGPDFSTQAIYRIIDELAAIKVFFVSLFGGEPFIRDDLVDIVDHLSKFPIGISINTNATLIDDSIAKRLSRYKISYVISLDGSSAEVVDSIRGRGTFERTLKGIDALRKYGGQILISATVLSQNFQDLSDIASFGRDIGAIGVRFNNVFFINNAECYLDEIMPTAEQYSFLLQACEELGREFGGFVSGSLIQTADYIKKINGGERAAYESDDTIAVHPCGAAVEQCAIRPDGEVLPCVILWNTPAGNVLERPLKEIWDNSKVLEEFRSVFYLSEQDIGDCIRCPYRYICFTGHRCSPYFYPGGAGNKKLFCIKSWLPAGYIHGSSKA